MNDARAHKYNELFLLHEPPHHSTHRKRSQQAASDVRAPALEQTANQRRDESSISRQHQRTSPLCYSIYQVDLYKHYENNFQEGYRLLPCPTHAVILRRGDKCPSFECTKKENWFLNIDEEERKERIHCSLQHRDDRCESEY